MPGVFDLNDGEMLFSIGLRIMIPCYLKEIDFEPSCTDEYFAVQEVSTVFIIQGKKVIVENEVLATALLRLPKSGGKPCFYISICAITTRKSAECSDVAGVQSITGSISHYACCERK